MSSSSAKWPSAPNQVGLATTRSPCTRASDTLHWTSPWLAKPSVRPKRSAWARSSTSNEPIRMVIGSEVVGLRQAAPEPVSIPADKTSRGAWIRGRGARPHHDDGLRDPIFPGLASWIADDPLAGAEPHHVQGNQADDHADGIIGRRVARYEEQDVLVDQNADSERRRAGREHQQRSEPSRDPPE